MPGIHNEMIITTGLWSPSLPHCLSVILPTYGPVLSVFYCRLTSQCSTYLMYGNPTVRLTDSLDTATPYLGNPIKKQTLA